MNPTALIADDEEPPRAQLLAALQATWPQLEIVATAANGVDAWDAFLEHEPAVCFLDIRMPGMTGLEVAQRIAGRALVVFVTAHGDHALSAFDAGAIDYVLKPVEAGRLAQTVARIQARLQAAPAAAPAELQNMLDSLVGQLKRAPRLDVVRAGVGHEVRLIRIEDVVYFESDSRYTKVVHADGEAFIRTPLKELIVGLDPDTFWQVHRSVIVNRHHVASALRIDEGHMIVTLRDRPEQLPVARPFQGFFKAQ